MRRLRQSEEQLDQALREKQRLEDENARLREENARLHKELETAQRAAKRQAAPFSRGKRKSPPKSPGRKSGKQYGQHRRRPIPDHVDEQIAVAVPEKCPECSGALTVERIEPQYQEEIVRSTWIRRFDIPICRCAQCGKRVQGRHPLQTSDALGAAAVQVGPEALTLGVLMNKAQGLPHADAAAILKQGFGLQMSRSGLCRAIQRVARKAESTWHALREAARRSRLAHMDETGWKVDAQLRWLWAVVTEQITYCEILPGRGFAQAAGILGADYAGWLIHDGWRIYYKFLKAAHQSGVAHLIRRCQDMAEVATPVAARFPRAVKALLEQGLSLRDRYLEQKISLHGLWTATGRLEAKLDRLLARNYREPANLAPGQASAPRTALSVYVSLLSRFGGCDQQPGRARDAHFGDDPQKLGWQPHGKRSPRASHPHQCAVHRPPAGQRRIPVAGGPAAIPATEGARHLASGVAC